VYFDLKKAHIYKALIFDKLFSVSLLRFASIIFVSLGILAGSAYLFTQQQNLLWSIITKFVPEDALVLLKNTDTQPLKDYADEYAQNLESYSATYEIASFAAPIFEPYFWVAIFYILSPIGASFLFVNIFFEFYLKKTIARDPKNLAGFLDYDSAFVMNNAITISNRLKENEISTDSLFIGIVDYEPSEIIFMRLGVSPKHLKKLLADSLGLNWSLLSKFSLYGKKNLSEDLMNLLVRANETRVKENRDHISVTDFLAPLFDLNPIFKQLVIDQDLDKTDLTTLSAWHEGNKARIDSKKRFWRIQNLIKSPPIGAEWTYGYPLTLTNFTRDITLPIKKSGKEIPMVNREKELAEMQQILAQHNNANILLVGEAGVGKRTIVAKLAEKTYGGKTEQQLNYKKILELDITLATSSSKYRGDIVNTLTELLKEAARVGNIILFIRDLQNFVGESEGLGKVDITGVLIPYLQSSQLQIIATTDSVGYHKHIANNSAVATSFSKINVEELGKIEVFKIIADMAVEIEAKSELFFTYGAMKTVVDDADKFISQAPFPEKGITLLHEVAGYVQAQRRALVTTQDVHEVITKKTNIPLGAISASEKKKLINLAEEMHKEIVGQEKAVSVVVQALQRLRSGLAKEGKPAGVFLFVGPTGVGKTLTAKMLAKHYFGSETRMIRFDMSEYQNKDSVDTLIGSLELNQPGRLITAVRDNPFSVLLLDEVEKAHPDILNLFLQVFDEGWITDAFGKKIRFDQNIIIATSNAAANYIREMVRQGIDPSMQKEKVVDVFVSESYFRPEFLNRFDEIVIFHPLTRDHIRKIADILIHKLVKRLEEKGYYYKPDEDAIDYISNVGFDPQFGARPMNRAIQDKIETVIARKILEGTVKKGRDFTLKVEEIE